MLKLNSQRNITGLIETYRIISIFLTLSIYIINGIFAGYAVSAMLLLACCIISSAFLLMHLYRISLDSKWRLNFLLIVEIIGIAVLMVLTGGLNSPFIWYFLNPLLIISCYMQYKEKALYLAVNFILLSAAGYYPEQNLQLTDYLLSHSNIILSYVLILILVNILFNYYDLMSKKREELRETNEKLESSNLKIKSLIEDILLMYEAVQAISNQRDKGEILHILLDFVGRISPAARSFFLPDASGKADNLVALTGISEDLKDELCKTVKDNYALLSKEHASLFPLHTGGRAVLIKVSNLSEYGIIGMIIPDEESHLEKEEYALSLLFFSRLGAILLEKIEVEAVNYELVIADEQNRIADDIHDIVVQRLFAMSCMTYDTLKKWDRLGDPEKKEQMTLAMETIQSSLKDLRSTIYNLSHKKRQIDLFKESVRLYLRDLERLSGTKINVDIDDGDDNLSTGAKKALYRIIIESTGNAIRHGKCRNIRVRLNIGDTNTRLIIEDDGTGFDPAQTEVERQGLGLYNIRSLIRIFNGSINIISDRHSHTALEIMFANGEIMKKLAEDQ